MVSLRLLTNTPAVSQLLKERDFSSLEDILRASRTPDLQTFNRSLLRLVHDEVIDQPTAMAYSSNPEELSLLLQGMSNSTQSFAQQVTEQEAIPNIKRCCIKRLAEVHLIYTSRHIENR